MRADLHRILLPIGVFGAAVIVPFISGRIGVSIAVLIGTFLFIFAWRVPTYERRPVLSILCTGKNFFNALQRNWFALTMAHAINLFILLFIDGILPKSVGYPAMALIISLCGNLHDRWSKLGKALTIIGFLSCVIVPLAFVIYLWQLEQGNRIVEHWPLTIFGIWGALMISTSAVLANDLITCALTIHARSQIVADVGALIPAKVPQIHDIQPRRIDSVHSPENPQAMPRGELAAPMPMLAPVPVPMPIQEKVIPAPAAKQPRNEVPIVSVDHMASQLFGQDRAISDWSDLLHQYLPYYSAGVVTRPLAVALVGPKGIGKKTCVRLLAKGPLKGLIIKELRMKTPGCFDEEDLQAITDGGSAWAQTVFVTHIEDQTGSISSLLQEGDCTQDQLIEALSSQVERRALRRFTRVIPFGSLDATACAQIAGLHLVEVVGRHGLIIERLDPRFLARCAQLGTASVMATGARAIQSEVPRLLGDGLERCKLLRAATIDLGLYDDDTVEFRITSTVL